MFYTDSARYAKYIISQDWLVEEVSAALNHGVKEGELPSFKIFMNRSLTMDYAVYTNIAGFIMMMTSATITVHYDI